MSRRAPLLALTGASGVSAFGSVMTLIAIPWFVLETTGSGASTGLVAAAESAGLLMSISLGGPLVDRYGGRRMSVLGDLTAMVLIAAIPLAHVTTGISLPALVALAFGIGLGRAPSRTAKQVLLPRAVTGAGTSVERGASALEAALRTGDLLGAPIGGVLIAALGAPRVLLVDAGCLLLAAVLVGSTNDVRSHTTAPLTGYLRELGEALRSLRADRLLFAVAALAAMFNAVFAGIEVVLIPAYGTLIWHDSAKVGLVIAAIGGGGLLGALCYGWVGARWRRRPTFAASFLLCGPMLLGLLALDPPAAVLVPLVAVCSMGNGPPNPIIAAVKYQRVPEAVRGRVFGAMAALAVGAMPLGTLGAGLLLDALGPEHAVLALCGVCLAVTLCPLVFPIWRELDAKPLVSV